MSQEISILLKAIDQASKIIADAGKNIRQSMGQVTDASKKVEDQQKQTSKSFDVMGQAATVATGILIRDMARGLGQAASESLRLGAQITSLNSAFESMVASTGGTTLSLERLRSATRNTVADVDLLRAANQAMALGLPTDSIDELFAAAMKLGRAMGIDTLSAVNSLATGIGRQSKLILDNLGVTFQASDAYEWYAAKIGVSSSALDENQKKLAWQEFAIEQVTERAAELGDIQDDAITSQEQWNASITNFLTSVGNVLAPLGAFRGAIEAVLPIITTVAATVIPQWISAHGGLLNSLRSVYGSIQQLPSAISNFANSTVAADVSVKGLAFSVGVGITAFAGIYSLLQSLPPETRQVAAAIAIITGALVAVATAAVVAWTSVSIGTALPVLLAGIGAAAAGVAICLQDAGVSADEYSDAMDEAAGTSQNFANVVENETNAALSELEASLQEELNAVETAFNEMVQIEEEAYNEKYAAMVHHFDDELADMRAYYDEELAETSAFYDDLIGKVRAGLDEIRNERSADLDDLELNYLLQKQALNELLETNQISQEEYNDRMTSLEQTYRTHRSEISDSYRIRELQYEQAHRGEVENLESQKKNELTRINQEKNTALQNLENTKNTSLENLESQHKTRMAQLEQSKANQLVAIHENYNVQAQNIRTSGNNRLLELQRTADNNMTAQVQQSAETQKQIMTNLFQAIITRRADIINAVNETSGRVNPPPSPVVSRAQAEAEAQAAFDRVMETMIGSYNVKLASARRAYDNVMKGYGFPSVYGYAEGGIALAPQLAVVAEKGPELMLPLDKLKNLGSRTYNVKIFATINNDMDVRKMARKLADYTAQEERSRGLS